VKDIDLARSLLEEDKWNLVIVKKGQVLFDSKERGIAPFFQAVRSIGNGLHNAAVADRVVGLAVAMLCLHARVGSVYAGIVSQGAFDTLKKNGVAIDGKSTVPHIFNRDGTDFCPFEKLAESCQEPSQLLTALESVFGEGNQ
jgi:Domain of unknown function (DUF1893)